MREMGRKKMHTKGDSLTILLHKHTQQSHTCTSTTRTINEDEANGSG